MGLSFLIRKTESIFMSNLKKFDYKGHPVTFEFADGTKMVNATEMAKPFKKRIDNYLRLKSTKDYILLLESRYSDVREREVLRIVQGGTPELQGTWFDEKLALKFAAWLSPEFELWVYDKIEELLKTGITQLEERPATDLIRAIRMIADKLEYQQRDINRNAEAINEIRDFVGELDAKITAIDENYYAVSGYCKLNNIHCPHKKAMAWGKQCTALSHQLNYDIGEAYHPIWGTVGSYHMDILKQVIK